VKDIRRIRQMREWLDTADGLSPAARRAAEAVVDRLADEWKTKHQERYDSAVTVRESKRKALTRRAGREAVAELRQLVIDIRAGRGSAGDARGKIRGYIAEHNRLTDLRNALVMSGEESLEEFAAKEPEDVQEEWLQRFPQVANRMPDLAALVEEKIQAEQARNRRSSNPSYEPTSDAPSAEDIRASRAENR
jgi:hypothetical protein